MKRYCSYFFILMLLISCQNKQNSGSGSNPGNPVNPTEKSSALLYQELISLLGRACTQSSDCFTVGIGARACGGPEDFAPLSKWDNQINIMNKVQEYTQRRKKDIEGMVGTCEALVPPASVCASNRCWRSPFYGNNSASALSVNEGYLMLSPYGLGHGPYMKMRLGSSEASPSYYVKSENLDLATRNLIESKRKSHQEVFLFVRFMATLQRAPLYTLMITYDGSLVDYYDLRALVILP
jgi:hypothetical protein